MFMCYRVCLTRKIINLLETIVYVVSTIFRRVVSTLTGDAVLPEHVKRNVRLLQCPCCGKKLNVDAVYLKEDPRFKSRIIERALSCQSCRIRIRQYIYL